MHCPFCNAPDTKVVDSRAAGGGDQVRRRRECLECKGRFTTYERVELNLPKVVKSDGRTVPFDEMKVKLGMLRALEKRPVTPEQVEAAMGRIIRKLMAPGEPEVPSRYIGDLVMEELKALDQVAYVRFASVYRQFEDVQAFREEIERLEQQPDPEALRKQLDLLRKD